jgi:hypothetical protein
VTLPAPLEMKDWFAASVQDYLGLQPTSTSPQPVHVLNGFLHSSLSGKRASRAATDLIAQKAGGQWGLSADDLRRKGSLELPSSDHDLMQVRRATRGLINTDRAVFAGFASFQLAHLGLVTSDRTHFKLGSLASRLALGPGAAATQLEGLIETLQVPQPNPHWALEAVLAEPGMTDDWEVVTPPEVNWWGTDPRCVRLAEDLGGVLRRVLMLADAGVDSLLAMQTLGIAATWCGLLTFAQVPSLLMDEGHLPLLLEAGVPGALPTLRDSSARGVDNVQRSFDNWLISRLTETVRELFHGEPPTNDEAHEFLSSSKLYTLSGGSQKSQERMPEIFDLWMKDSGDTFAALGSALGDGLKSSMGDKPRSWFAAVGRHCGFVGPRRGYPARFRVEVALVPALVLAGMSDDDGPSVPFKLWQERLAERFGLYFGPNAAVRQTTPRASEEDLAANSAALAHLLYSLGMARRFSDSVTEVLNPLVLWQKS